jgi:RNA polymerase sigma-70 factor (ECF subfamily)
MRNTTAEQQLIERLRTGDESAVAELASAYGPKIHQLALRYLKNREDAEEVAQDVLYKVCRKIDAFRGDSALSSWIYRITFNAAMSRLRNGRFSRPSEIAESAGWSHDDSGVVSRREPADWSSLADDEVMRGELRRRGRAAGRELPAL